MAKPIVLLIHGMGTHPDESTKKAFIKGLTEGAKFLKFDTFNPKLFNIHEFNYSDELDTIRTEIAEHADNVSKITELLTAAGGAVEIAGDLIDWQTELDNDEFLYTHLFDVILYALTFHGVEISIRLANQIRELLALAHQKNTKLHIVAHSLGTKVVTDAMYRLFANDVTVEGALQIDPALMRPASLWMISNVSRLVGILDPLPDPYKTIVTDHYDLEAGTLGGTATMYNISNTFDPFTWFLKYDMEPMNGYNIDFSDVRKITGESSFINPHSLSEYFAYPETARQFLQVVADYSVPTETFLTSEAKYKEGTVEGTVKTLLEQIKHPVDDGLPTDANIVDKVRHIIKAYKALKSIKEQTKAYFSTGGQ
jgi:hypothetical protein